jgi:hypothetical protein
MNIGKAEEKVIQQVKVYEKQFGVEVAEAKISGTSLAHRPR